MIEENLRKLGLNNKEIAVFLGVFEHGKVSPARLAKITNLNRTTVYAVAKELLKKGLVIEDLGGKTKYLVALPPQELGNIVKREKKELEKKEIFVQSVIEELSHLPKSKSFSVPKIRFVEEYELEEFLYKETPLWEKSMKQAKDTTWRGFQDHTLVEDKRYREWIEWYWKQAPKEFDLKLLSNDSRIEKQMAKKNLDRRVIKFWKENIKFTATNWIIGDYVVMIVTNQKPNYLVEIHDTVYAQNMRELFKNLWEEIS